MDTISNEYSKLVNSRGDLSRNLTTSISPSREELNSPQRKDLKQEMKALNDLTNYLHHDDDAVNVF